MPKTKSYCYETCSREEARVRAGNAAAHWVRVKTGEIYCYVLMDLRSLPEGAEYVRPVKEHSR